jgi:hypothetical protein
MDPHSRNGDEEEYTEDLIRDGEDITSYLNLEGEMIAQVMEWMEKMTTPVVNEP